MIKLKNLKVILMQNFESKILGTRKVLKILGIFDKNNIDQKIIDIDKQTQDKDFGKTIKRLKKLLKKKIF